MFRFAQTMVAAALLSFGGSSPAAEVRWSGEESCRRDSELAAQVETMTGRSIASVELADFELRVESRSRSHWSLELTTVRRADGTRSTRAIHGASCAEVTDAAAVAIALAIGQRPEEPSSESESRPNPVPPAPALPTRPAAEPRRPAQGQNSLDWTAGIAATLDSSSTPSAAFGASARFGVGWYPAEPRKTGLRFELEGAFYAPTETSTVAGQAGKFQLVYGAPFVCGAKPLGATTLLMCTGVELGQLSAEGIGDAVTTSHLSNTFWSAARAELGVGYPRGGALRVVGRGGVAMPLIRQEFVIDGPDVVFRPPAISARIGLGVELSL